jgi:hypothetical protein
VSKLSKKLIEPHSILIEKTAAEFAGTFFEAARSSGMGIINLQGERIDLRRYKNNPVKFAKVHLEKFIPAATHSLIEIMSRENTPVSFKEQIYQAIMERTNDEQLSDLGRAAMLPEYEKTVLYKSDQEKPTPIIVNAIKKVL